MPFAIRGVIWYQAEGNNGDPARYETLFPAMIRSWREGWGEPALPFLFVQLPACKNTTPLMREVQARCARRVPNAAMVVTLDVGEAENIHPRNKEPVGLRLALKARALVYGEKVEHSGPVFTAVQVQDGSLVLSFEHAGGLRARDGELCGFEVAGADGRFFAARAKIEGEAVRLTCAKAKSPTQVRYAWANVPDANLVNAAGLPAEPFQSAP
jgi:sialate O-acetylesterase